MSSAPAPAPAPRRSGPAVFRRQNSFAGFPSVGIHANLFHNNNNNNNPRPPPPITSGAPTAVSSTEAYGANGGGGGGGIGGGGGGGGGVGVGGSSSSSVSTNGTASGSNLLKGPPPKPPPGFQSQEQPYQGSQPQPPHQVHQGQQGGGSYHGGGGGGGLHFPPALSSLPPYPGYPSSLPRCGPPGRAFYSLPRSGTKSGFYGHPGHFRGLPYQGMIHHGPPHQQRPQPLLPFTHALPAAPAVLPPSGSRPLCPPPVPTSVRLGGPPTAAPQPISVSRPLPAARAGGTHPARSQTHKRHPADGSGAQHGPAHKGPPRIYTSWHQSLPRREAKVPPPSTFYSLPRGQPHHHHYFTPHPHQPLAMPPSRTPATYQSLPRRPSGGALPAGEGGGGGGGGGGAGGGGGGRGGGTGGPGGRELKYDPMPRRDMKGIETTPPVPPPTAFKPVIPRRESKGSVEPLYQGLYKPRRSPDDDNDDDGLYSTIKPPRTSDDPLYQSPPELLYTRPQPPEAFSRPQISSSTYTRPPEPTYTRPQPPEPLYCRSPDPPYSRLQPTEPPPPPLSRPQQQPDSSYSRQPKTEVSSSFSRPPIPPLDPSIPRTQQSEHAYSRPEPSFSRPLPPEPSFSRPQPPEPSFSRPQPPEPPYSRAPAPEPPLSRLQPLETTFSGPQPHEPSFSRPKPPEPPFSRPQPPEPPFSRPQPPEPSFLRTQPPETSFSRPQPQEPSFSRPQPPEPLFSRPQAPETTFSRPHATESSSTFSRPQPPETSFPSRPQPDESRPPIPEPRFSRPQPPPDATYSSLSRPSPPDPIYTRPPHPDSSYKRPPPPPEPAYTRPLPPMPAPTRYRRRTMEPEDVPPPLPPPRLTTGPLGSHNPLVSSPLGPPPPVPPTVTQPSRTRVPSSSYRHSMSSYASSSTSPSPEDLLTRSCPPVIPPRSWPAIASSGEESEDLYSSIPSLVSTTPDSPPSANSPPLPPRVPKRVTASASWDSLGSTNREASSAAAAARRRRRCKSDPRVDAGVLHRLAFTIWHTALHIEKENNSDAAAGQKQATLGSRNTQSAARQQQQRLMAGHGVSGGGLVGVGPPSSSSAGGSHSGKGPRMDVVYVTERIISLSFPADVDDATYRLHLREVARMLSSKHGDNFKVFNLSHHGELSRFLPRISELGWPEQLAPALERLCSICKALDSWVNQHNLHVAVLHARGGYEKLGVVVAAYMHYSNICASTDQALDRYAMKRFFDDKIGQLYHPSQKRYVQYFAGLLSGVIRINSSPLYLHTLTLYGIPHFEARGGCHLFVKIYQGMTPLHTTGVYNLTDTMRQVTIAFEGGVQLRGDILLKAYHRRLVPASREIIFRIQFHTCAVSEKLLSFTRHDLDDACNDMRFPSDGGVELYFSNSGDDRPRTTASTVSCDTSPCAITAWDSYKDLDLSHEHHEQGAGITGSSRSGQQGVGSSSGGVSYTLGPLDGSLYATVTKKKAASALVSPPGSSSSGSGPQAISGPHAPSPTVSSPSPNTFVNGRHAASLDSGIASSNSAVVAVAPVSPPTSDSSRASAESRGIGAPKQSAATAAAVVAPAPHVDASQLDELLHGMLLDIENIPDLRPCQTPAPDIDSIRCPDFSNMAPKLESRSTSRSAGSDLTQLYQHYSTTTTTTTSSSDNYGPTSPVPTTTHSPINSFSVSTTHDSLLDSSLNTTSEDMPYHARSDSKPFSYGGFTSSPMLGGRLRSTSESGAADVTPAPPAQQQQPPPSPSIHRRNSRETLGTQRSGLESPRLVRRMSGSVGASSPHEGSGRRSPSLSPSPEPCGSRGGTLQRQRSHTLTSRIMAGHGETTPTSTLNRSDMTRSASRLDDSMDLSFSPEPLNCSAGSSSSNLSWLQIQQRKLQERREAKMRAERAPQEARVLSELRTRMTQQRTTSSSTTGREGEDGYVSDTTLLSETSRESSPVKTLPPLTINTSSATPQKPPIAHSTPARGNSAPSSPILSARSSVSKEHSLIRQQAQEKSCVSSTISTAQTTAAATSTIPRSGSLSRKGSDTDRERPFMAVKRAHEHAKPGDISDSATALSQLQTSPLGHINYSTYNTSSTSEGLLTTVQSTSSTTDQQTREENTWQSDTEGSVGGTRPITPGFPPATPTTPYLNQGLPPKSPTMQRKDMGGVRSPSPAVSSQHASSSNRQQEVNGHASPAPSLYHSQSRRSSLTSLTDTMEVISSHPKFVKDISKFWYKPSITRDEAISTLRDKPPGTFVVRDSNSFPGAFGLALKVATPPLNVANKSGDPANELVRHFLIEPTSRGVRLKGCSNEPVFGSLSALVYQHSITALALPCRLVMPERDPSAPPVDTIDSSSNLATSSTTQLLQQGAACSVLYLYSADMESLTGPQAIKRGVTLLLGAKNITATIVHFKVSAQGITMTDNERKLFFRRHYPVNTISHCGLDPDDRRWAQKNEEGAPVGSLRLFGFVAKKGASRTDNLCHVLAELEPEQPATAIVNFVTKVMMTSVSRPNLV
ncbi:tensin-3-like isoform X2 [Oratosquilla oratoria]|uniref:tensin-3-like isoform X2 n=1 Tax=Oratosquilla oratoria TaxID=337810 RepID=UPI003F75C324